MKQISDDILMEKIKGGEVDPLGILYDRHKDTLFNYFLRTTYNYEASNDLLMDTFERVYKYRHTFKQGHTFRPWLYRITNNLIKDHFKKTSKSGTLEHLSQSLTDESSDKVFDLKNDQELLYAAMQQLPPRERSIINMYYLLEFPYESIAEIENISINTARIIVCRGLKKLNQLLKKAGL